ncbi:MAG: hypothetical protein MUP55_04825 [Candidatus Aenigmarchaeota archaeon]|nr:hypothetical protein [Candidatus Aenigmarchaeota archaeon]
MGLPLDFLQDELERQIEHPIESLNPALEDPLFQMQSILETRMENTIQYNPTTTRVLPGMDYPKEPEPIRGVRPPDPPVPQEPYSRYEPFAYPLYRFHGSRSGARRSEEGEWCFDRERYIRREEDCEQGCSHWDSERMECVYFEDWERDHSPQED